MYKNIVLVSDKERHLASHNFEKVLVLVCERHSCGTRCYEPRCWSPEEIVGGYVTGTWVAGTLLWICPIIETELPLGRLLQMWKWHGLGPPLWGSGARGGSGGGHYIRCDRCCWGDMSTERCWESRWILTTCLPGTHSVWCASDSRHGSLLVFATSNRSPQDYTTMHSGELHQVPPAVRCPLPGLCTTAAHYYQWK